MNTQEFLDSMSEINPGALYPTGFEDAIVGYVEGTGVSPRILLNREKCVRMLMENSDRCDRDEAEEYFDFNVLGSYFGERSPCFVTFKEDM